LRHNIWYKYPPACAIGAHAGHITTIPMLVATPTKEEFVLEIHQRLSDVYGRQIKYFHDLDPLSELVSALLSHRTKNRDSGQAFKNLMEIFGTWEAVRPAYSRYCAW
jgi:hypothetical protein